MPDWLMSLLSGLQRTVTSELAAELRAGGWMTPALAFALGALHALTPGHGQAALAAYFLGQDARIATGLRITLTAAFIHVLMGALAFVVLQFVLGRLPMMTGRGSPVFAAAGYGLILLAGLLMLAQSLRPMPAGAGEQTLTLGIGLLPCPLTILILGFAWAQGTSAMVALVLVALAAGIALTIGAVALGAIVARRTMGLALMRHVPGLERWARILQSVAGTAIVAISAYAIWQIL